MKQFIGETNITNSIIGRVEKSNPESKLYYIYKNKCEYNKDTTYFLYDNSKDKINKNKNYFKLIGSSLQIKNHDIVLIQTSGNGTLLYENGKDDNTLIVTHNCNNECIMCSQPPRHEEDNYLSMNLKIVNLIKNQPNYLCISGGEPTIKWSDFIKLVELVNIKLPLTNVFILSNARVFSEYNKAQMLAKLAKDKVKIAVPLFSDTDDIHDYIAGIEGAFWETVNGLLNLHRVGISIEIRVIIMKQNVNRLSNLIYFIYHNFPFIEHIALMGLEITGNAKKNLNDIWIDPKVATSSIRNAILNANRRNMPISLYNFPLCTIPKYLWKYARKSISEWKRVFLPNCNECKVKKLCCGIFNTNIGVLQKNINPIL